ncbi:MAG TPA: ribonuclease Y [Candidatus Polarisedimenticolia bacterium]|nr:ribonuclease Y [Candidatus Polarisedimenticolia bacterium]
MAGTTIALAAAAALALAAASALLGWVLNNRAGKASAAAAREQARRILAETEQRAEADRKAAVLSAKDEWYRTRKQLEREARDRQKQLQTLQKQAEETQAALQESAIQLKRREQSLRDKERNLQDLERQAREKNQALETATREVTERLEAISGLTAEEAKKVLLGNLKNETRFEAARMIKEIKDEAQRNAEVEAQKIISLAIERQAADYSNEKTVTAVPLPSEKMKGRLIGHEGKNIKAFEKFVGVQLVVDDSPDSVVLSGFNPIKREIARMCLEKMMKEGNITPRRIEDVSNEMKRKMVRNIQRIGEEALKEMKIEGVHPEIVRLLGRLRYRTSYGQNVLEHSKEVGRLTELMALELRLDGKLARRAGLFHDIGKAIDYEREGTHPEIGFEVARKYNEPLIVQNAIASHHEDVEVISPISVLVSAADAISGARPGARRRTTVDYVKRIEQLEQLADSMEGVEQSFAIQAGREIRVIARHDKLDDAQSALLASTLAQKIQQEMEYPGKIKVTVIREMRAVDYAR